MSGELDEIQTKMQITKSEMKRILMKHREEKEVKKWHTER
jgi:hypothetical protein